MAKKKPEIKTNGKTRTNGRKNEFHKMLDALPAAVYTTDAKGNLTYFNRAAVEFSGREPELGTDKWCVTWKLYYPDGAHMPHEECPMAVALKEGRNDYGHEAIAERPDGKRIWFMPYPSPLFDEEGNITGGINMFVDITERKKRERADALLGAVVNNSDDAIISKDLDGIIKSWNKAAEELFGYSEDEAVGKSITILLPEDRVSEEDQILDKISCDKKLDHYETVRQRKDGTFVNVSLTISPIKDSNGQIIGASKIARDITKRKQQEEELRALNENLEERVEQRTASLISYQKQLRSLAMQLSRAEEEERRRLATELHDNLGQMLAVIKMKLNFMQKNGDTEAITETMQLVDESIQYSRKLMSDLKPPPSMKNENISNSITWVIKAMEQYDLNIYFDDGLQNEPPVDEDIQSTVVQAVRELLFNVVKYAESNEAHIKLSFPGSLVKVTVEDDGVGFDSKNIEFTATEDGGFGLFHVKERLDVMGGQADIESKPGEGTKITLTMPLEGDGKEQADGEQTANEEQEQQETAAEESGSKIKVLLVDDHDMMRDGLRRIIESENDLTVIAEAPDAESAIDAVDDAKPDVVIMDINLPGMNGIEATSIIKNDHPEIKIIGLSFHDDEEVSREMHEAGASAYLEKANASEALCAAIRSEGIASELK